MGSEAAKDPRDEYTEEGLDETIELIIEAYSSINELLKSDCLMHKIFATQILATMNEKFTEFSAFLMEGKKLSLEETMQAVKMNKTERGKHINEKAEEILHEMKMGTAMIQESINLPAKASPAAKTRKKLRRRGRKNRRMMD